MFQAASFQTKKDLGSIGFSTEKSSFFVRQKMAAVSPAPSETLGAAMFAGPFLRAFRPGAAELLLSGDFQVLEKKHWGVVE